MPGFELIGTEEKEELLKIFDESNGVMFAHGFDALRKGHFRVREFEGQFAQKMHGKYAQAVSSGTTALVAAMKALGVKAGDEVITQSFTFVATVEAILFLGATPILTEIDDTYNMDPDDLKSKINKRTKLIVPVHMAGVPARMDEIMSIAQQHNLYVLEDNAQGIGASYKGKPLGSIGDIGTFSLDFGKTITTGEGGIILTNNQELYQFVREFHDHGHEYNPSVGRADDTRKTWGLNFRMSELNAAVGIAQLRKVDFIVSQSQKNKNIIQNNLSDIPGISFRTVPDGAIESGDALYFSFDNKERVNKVLIKLKEMGIGTKNIPDALKWHFASEWEHIFNDHPTYKETYKNAWPKSKDLLSRTIALPVMVKWTEQQLNDFISKVKTAILSAT